MQCGKVQSNLPVSPQFSASGHPGSLVKEAKGGGVCRAGLLPQQELPVPQHLRQSSQLLVNQVINVCI